MNTFDKLVIALMLIIAIGSLKLSYDMYQTSLTYIVKM